MKGQALITLLFFALIGTTIISAAIMMTLLNSLSGTKLQQGMVAYQIAKSGTENALIRLLRNPNYTGETFAVGNGSATIQVSGGGASPYTILSQGTLGNFVRKIQVIASYTNNRLTVISQQEVF